MPAALTRAKSTFARLRARFPALDHLIRMNKHYGTVRAGALAGAVTYFGFLSFFPLLALAFAAVGFISAADPHAQAQITDAVTQAFPGLVGTAPNQINIQTFIDHKSSVGIVGLVSLLVAGLGWLDALREAIRQVFGLMPSKRNFVVAKLVDVVVLALLGSVVLLSAVVTSASSLVTGWLLGLVNQDGSTAAKVLLIVVSVALAVAADTLVLVLFFTRLPGHRLPWRNTIHGAILGAVGIEALKQIASTLLKSTTSNPLYASFAIVVGLLVWINFLSRVMLYAASWAVTGPEPTVQSSTVLDADVLDEQEADAISGLARPEADEALAKTRRERDASLNPHAGPLTAKQRLAAFAGVVALVAVRRKPRVSLTK